MSGTLTIVDASNPGQSRWPGAMVVAPDGTALAAFERYGLDGFPSALVREAPSITGPWLDSAETEITFGERDAFDPSWMLLDGSYWPLSQGFQVWTCRRRGPGLYDPAVALYGPAGDEIDESVAWRANGKTYVTDVRRAQFTGDAFDVRVREVVFDSGSKLPVAGVPVTIAEKATGLEARNGQQLRVALVQSGSPRGLIAAWSSAADISLEKDQRERSIMVATSDDDGATWSEPRTALQYVGHDLFNPFSVYVSPVRQRFFFAQDRSSAKCGWIETHDHGATWMQGKLLFPPSNTSFGHAWALKAAGHWYMFAGYGGGQLAVFDFTL